MTTGEQPFQFLVVRDRELEELKTENAELRAENKLLRTAYLLPEDKVLLASIDRLNAYVEEWKRRYETARLAHEEGHAEIERLKRIIGYLEEHADIPISVRKEARRQFPPQA